MIGCGHGRTLARLAKTPRAHLAGIDPSEVMVRLVRKRLLLGYRARDERTLAALPATVYTLRSVEEIEKLLAESGFLEIQSIERSIGKARFTYSEARRPGLYERPVESSAEAEVASR